MKGRLRHLMKEKKKSALFFITLFSMKALTKFLRLIGKRGTHLPGNLALHMCHDFLGQIDKPPVIIGVTGTNGKTTVTNMIDTVLTDNGYSVACNRFGGNIDAGIAAALMADLDLHGRTKMQVAVLEIDERMTPNIFPYVKPNFLICTNLFRDSYKRNAHSEFIVSILTQQIPKESYLILNGEDLISNHLAPKNNRVYFGIECETSTSTPNDNIIQDMVICPICNTPLNYEYTRYNHIGKAFCPNCSFGSPAMNYAVTAIDEQNRRITIRTPDENEDYKLMGDNITDLYNTVSAVTVLREFGLSSDQINFSLENQKIVASRFDEIKVGNKRIIMNLAKGQNPIACSRVFDFLRHIEGKKAVILAFDDYFDAIASTENVAWIFDADFEFLNQVDIVQVIAGGPRCTDMRVRLLMAGIPEEKIYFCDKEIDTPSLLKLQDCDTVCILYDIYTHLYATTIRDAVEKLLKAEGGV